jgi:MFS family permease
VANILILLRRAKELTALYTFILVAAFISLLCLVFVPCWERNDDVAMSMIAHGYGLAAYGSPHLVFSNILWGYLVRAIPTVNGVLGYSLATMGSLLVVGWAILYFLIRLGAGYLIGFLAVSLLIALPTLNPQFTVSAGLMTVAAIIGWQAHARLGGLGNLVVACVLAFCGYLIRGQEFFLVLGVALPFLPWRAFRERRQMQIAFLLLGVAIASAAAFDRWSYSGIEWQHFKEFNSVRIPITDYRAGEHLKLRPEILSAYGYSWNDIDLLENWFFVDPQIADSKALNAMLTELGPLPMQEGSIQAGFEAIQALYTPMLLSLILSGLFLFMILPRWSMALAWVLCLAAIFAMGVMGRPGALRVYIPLVCLLFIFPLVVGKCRAGIRPWMITGTLFIAWVGSAYLYIPAALISKQWVQQVRKDIQALPEGPIIIWGGGEFPFELAFPVLSNDLNSRNIKFFGLDSLTHAPLSVANAEQAAGRGMLERLQTTTGVPIIASPETLELLRIYCSERFKGQLHGFSTYQSRSLTVQQVRCTRD